MAQGKRNISEKGYAHPEALATIEWVAEHLNDTENVRITGSDEDVLLYDTGHIPDAEDRLGGGPQRHLL